VTPARVVVRGITSLKRKIAAYSASLLSPVQMWETIKVELEAAEMAWFESEGEGTWKPLSPEYAGKKAALFPGQPILVATGDLKDWLTNPAKAAKITSPDTMQWVNSYDTPDGRWNLAELHRDGTPKMPARTPIIPHSRLVEIAVAAARVQAVWR
jgi:hypothetical protein